MGNAPRLGSAHFLGTPCRSSLHHQMPARPISPLPDTAPSVPTPWGPFPSLCPASRTPDTHQPWSISCSTAEGTPPLRPYLCPAWIPETSLTQPQGSWGGGGGLLVSKQLFPVPSHRLRRAGQLVLTEDSQCLSRLVFRKLPGKNCAVEKTPGPELRGPSLPPRTGGSVTQ